MTDVKKIIALGLFFLIQTISVGQNKRHFLLDVDSLRKSGVDTFFLYRPYCIGDVKGFTIPRNATKQEIQELECENSETSFAFYKSKGNLFVSKYNECYKSSPIPINDSKAFSFFFLHYNEIADDTVRDAAYIDKNGKKYFVSIDHSCYRSVYISISRWKFCNFDFFDLNEVVSDEKNINYTHNIETSLLKFTYIIDEELDKLKFVRQPPP